MIGMDTTQAAPAAGSTAPDARRHRPSSLREVAALAAVLGNIDGFLREFLDAYYTQDDPKRRTAMLAEEPQMLESERANAYLAAVAEHLSRCDRMSQPRWPNEPTRFLKRPFFPAGLESLKAQLLIESPSAFRRRLIFVGADPLYRPRKTSRGFTS